MQCFVRSVISEICSRRVALFRLSRKGRILLSNSRIAFGLILALVLLPDVNGVGSEF